ncbi:MAG: SBBP repeat-containing protein [Myxococcota bacterium]
MKLKNIIITIIILSLYIYACNLHLKYVCTPSCNGKECGDDGRGRSCGSCGSNASCDLNRCVCNSGYANCNNSWTDGCETIGDPGHLWSKGFGGSSYDYGSSVSVDTSGNVYGTGYFLSSLINFGGCIFNSAGSNDIYLFKYAP